jgi:hypothetical protein
MGRSGLLDERPGHLRTGYLQADVDNLKSERVELLPQCLPPGQVPATASIGGPGDEGRLLAAKRAQRELMTV